MGRRPKSEVLSSQPRVAILEAAAEIIVERGTKEVDISELAKRAGVTRQTIYSLFGRGELDSVKNSIYQNIVSEFLRVASESIRLGLGFVHGSATTPGEQLWAILRATLIAFRENQLYGKVVLQELNLRNPEEQNLIRPIFAKADEVIKKARRDHELSTLAPKDDWKIRQALFVLTRGLLRTLYLDQFDKRGKPFDKPEMTEQDVEVEVLQLLLLYLTKHSQEKITKTIAAMKRPVKNKSTTGGPVS